MTEYVHRLRSLVGPDELLQLPSASVALRDRSGRVLLARHAETGEWIIPGGCIEPGETPADAAVREMWEETGLLVRPTRLLGVFGGRDLVVRYRNGHRTSYVMAAFEAEEAGGRLSPDPSEILEARFVSAEDTSALAVAPWLRPVLEAVFRGRREAAFLSASWAPPSGGPR